MRVRSLEREMGEGGGAPSAPDWYPKPDAGAEARHVDGWWVEGLRSRCAPGYGLDRVRRWRRSRFSACAPRFLARPGG